MKLKDKTKLRKVILRSIGNTGQLRNIWVYKSGEWDIVGTSTSPCDNSSVCVHHMMEFTEHYGPNDYEQTYAQTQKAITTFFQEVEDGNEPIWRG